MAALAAAELRGIEMSSNATTITKLYEQIPLEAMQQVADSYMSWYVEKATSELDATIARLRSELEENDKQEALFKPSAAELDAMRRLQTNKVIEAALLDRLVEQGEEWLVLTMHRLDYFERAGLAPHDYPGWCEHALSGAYDWIDAARLHASKRMFSLQGGATGPMRAVRPSDLAALKTEATGPVRSAEPAAPKAPPAPQPQRTEPAQPKPAQAARAPEGADPSTQPVPVILQPAPAASASGSGQIAQIETAPLPPPAQRPDMPRQSAPMTQAPQRPPAQAASPIVDTPTRPTPVAPSAQEMPVPPRQRPAPAAGNPPAAPAPQRPPTGAVPGGQAQAPQRPAPSGANVQPGQPAAPQRRPEQQPPAAAARPQPPAAQPSGPLQQPQAGQKQRPAPNWYQEPRPDPRYSLDDVEVDDLDEEGDDQGLLRKIFRVFTG